MGTFGDSSGGLGSFNRRLSDFVEMRRRSSMMSSSSIAAAAARCATTNDENDDRDNGDVVISHNAVVLNDMMEDSLLDIEKQLRYWGKRGRGSVLEEDAFHNLLDDIGYGRCRDGLFDGLLADVKRATQASTTPSSSSSRAHEPSSSDGSGTGGDRVVTLNDMRNLYSSESYHLPAISSFNNGEALMAYVMQLFDDWNMDMDDGLETSKLGEFLFDMFDGRRLTDEELSEVSRGGWGCTTHFPPFTFRVDDALPLKKSSLIKHRRSRNWMPTATERLT
jgi:hypothetical protein